MTTAEHLRRWLVEQIAETCELDEDEIDVLKPLDEYGLSSRDAVALSGELEELLDRSLPTTLLWDHPTIERLAAALATAGPTATPDDPGPAAPATTAGAGEDAIAVVGLGCRLPGGVHGPERFWRLLTEGRDAIAEVPQDRWSGYADVPEDTTRFGGFLDDIAGFDAEFFGIAPREAARMDPQQRMVLEVAWEALQHAGIAPSSLRGSNTGVFVGISGTEYGSLSLADLSGVDAWTGTGAALSIAANRLSYVLDLRGPSLSVDTACSSSLTSVHLAVRSLRSGESDLALVGGANLLLGPGVTANFDQMGITSKDGRCKPFSADADGIARAEGAGMVVLKRLSAARADGDRVLAVIRGSAANSDGRSNGLTAPNPEAQQALLRTAYADAGIDPATVDYVEAHGTGTLLGDPIEARALGAALGRDRDTGRPLLLGSVKSNLGHLEAAAGIVGLIKVVLALHHGELPASLNFAAPNPHIDFDGLHLAVVAEGRHWPQGAGRRVAGVSGFGFGGTNAHVVLEGVAADTATQAADGGHRRFVLGAPDPARLRAAAGALADHLARDGAPALADLEHTLARRLDGRTRAAVIATGADDLVTGLRSLARGEQSPATVTATLGHGGPGPVFVFSGHGSQWAGMANKLLAEEPVFAAAVDRLDPLIRAESGFSLREDLLGAVEADTMDHVQPLVFGLQLALVDLWRAYGAEPAAVIGHSFGEVTAAVVAGALSEADGARVVALRSRLLASLAGDGAMALLEVGAEEAGELVEGLSDVDVAVLSAPNQTVIAGAADEVRRIVSDVDSRGLLAKLVKLDVAAHSPIVDSVTGTLLEGLGGLTPARPRLDFYSTSLADARQKPAFDPAYWARNLRQPVRFTGAVSAAVADGYSTFVEVSPHPVLRHALTDNLTTLAGPGALVLSSLRNCADETAHFHTQLATLQLTGSVATAAPGAGRIVDLPTTAWRHTRHWLPRPAARPTTDGTHPLLGAHAEVPGEDRHVWRGDLGSLALPWLSDQRCDGRPVLPATAYLELAGAAARATFGEPAERIALRDVTLHEPLPLAERTTVSTSLTPTGRRTATVGVHTRPEGGSWRLHATAEVSVVDVPATATVLDAPDETGFTPVSTTDLAARELAPGLAYGPGFSRLSSARRRTLDGGAAVALARVGRPEPADRSLRLHPALLESCLRVFGVALADFDPGLVHRPARFGAVRLHGDPARGVLVYASVTAEGEDLLGELHLVDRNGTVLLELADVVLRPAGRAELAAPLPERLLETVWRPAELTAPARPARRIVLLSAGGHPVADALAATDAEVRHADYRDEAAVRAAISTGEDVSLVFLTPADGTGLDALARAEEAVLAIAGSVRTLVEGDRTGATRLWLVTTGAAAVGEHDRVRPAFSALRGLVRVLNYEHPELAPAIVDLDPAFSAADAARALRSEFDGGHDDEVALRRDGRHALRLEWAPAPAPGATTAPVVRPDGAYLLTGGLGGLGIFLAGWLSRQGAGRIVLNGRSAPKPEAAAAIAAMAADVRVVLGDLAEPGVAQRLVEAATEGGVPLRGVLHAAAVFDDLTTTRLDAATLHRTWLPKAYGGWRLHEATTMDTLDWWVGFSSSATLPGLPGQPAYSSANAYLDALVAMRRADGLPATSVAWGNWAQIGAAARLEIPWMHQIQPEECLAVLTAVLTEDRPTTGALRLNAGRLVEAFPDLADVTFFRDILAGHAPAARRQDDWLGPERLRALPPAQARAAVSAQLTDRIASILGFTTDGLDTAAPLSALGVDSLLAVRIRNAVQHDFEVSLPMSLLLRGASVTDARGWLCDELGLAPATVGAGATRAARRGPAEPVLIGPRDAAERLVTSAWKDVLGREVGVTQDFYGIGGSRQKAEAVTALLAERSGRELTISELFEHPTIERMAEHLREEEHTGSPVRTLRGTGTQAPLFFFHPGGGDTAVYRQLTDLLDEDIPVYGFDRIDGVTAVEDRVERYLPELRAVQAHGPYRLAGWSFGGFLAYEMAQQLRAAGEDVELVALIDPILPLPNETGLSEEQLLEKRFERFQEFLEASYGKRVDLPYARMARVGPEEQVQMLIDSMIGAELVNSEVSEAILHHQRTSFLDARSLEFYRPTRCEEHVVFFSAADQVPGGLRDQRFDRTDPARGWDGVCTDIEVITVPGHHLSLLDPPHVDRIAEYLGEMLAGRRSPVGAR
jgi:phthiocerol/phenolphthiocerol synthesis type-I polyketide synthase D